MDFLIDIDTDIFLFFNGMHCDFIDRFMKLASDRFVWVPLYVALLVALVRMFGWRKAVIITLAAIVAVTASDQLCAAVIRPEVQRLRPANLANPLSPLVHVVDGYRGGSYGFPSCHAANTFALVGLMLPLVRDVRFGIVMVVWALLNCYSRIHLGVHYPGDLLVGGLIGASIGLICFYMVRVLAFGGNVAASTRRDLNLWHVRMCNSDIVTFLFTITLAVIAVAAI